MPPAWRPWRAAGSAEAAGPGNAITGTRRAPARRAASGAAKCVQRTESSGVDSHPVARRMVCCRGPAPGRGSAKTGWR